MATTPRVILFDVNETLSDMSALGSRFSDIGLAPELSTLWFATLLRDGFALTASTDNVPFADIGAGALRVLLAGKSINRPLDAAIAHVMEGLIGLPLHDDVPKGIVALADAEYRLVTLSNGSASIAEKLFTEAGIRVHFELLLSVEDAPAWKPAPESYSYAATRLGVEPAEILLVAVHPWDIHGAARAGLNTAWLNRGNGTYPPHFAPPNITVTSLRDLPAALSVPR